MGGNNKGSAIAKSAGDLTQPLKRTTSNSTPNTPLISKNKSIVKTLNDRIKSFEEEEEDLDFVNDRPHNNFSSDISKGLEDIIDKKESSATSKFVSQNLVKPSQVRNLKPSENNFIGPTDQNNNQLDLSSSQNSDNLNNSSSRGPIYKQNSTNNYSSSISPQTSPRRNKSEQILTSNRSENEKNNNNNNISTKIQNFKNLDNSKNSSMVNASNLHHRESVGFATLPNQIHQKAIRRGFEFSLMVCGESGLGKSTLLNSLFLTNIYDVQYPGPSKRAAKTVAVHETEIKLEEAGVELKLNVIDTPGYGDHLNNSSSWNQIADFIEDKFERYLNDESRVNRSPCPSDKRVHACLYFIAPSGHGMKALDIEFMKRLHDKVNIIPVIAKADALTPEEIIAFKQTILMQINENGINIYSFPDLENSADHTKLRNKIPFAVIGSNYVLESNNKHIRARQYPWGFAEIENTDHCDFSCLRKMLLQTHMQDLIDTTATYHYENFRQRKLSPVVSTLIPPDSTSNEGGSNDGTSYDAMQVDKNPIEQIEEEKRNHKTRMQQMEEEMENVFQLKVQEKKKRLKDSEMELQRRHETMKKKMDEEWENLEKKRKDFELAKRRWEEDNRQHLDKLNKTKTKKSGW